MPINNHPETGAILLCDFNQGFVQPEMVKRRPVIVISPKISVRPGLCTVVALSTTPPTPIMSYHYKITMQPPLPAPWDSAECWVKGDMVCAVGFHRLDFVRLGKDKQGKRLYRYDPIPKLDLREVRRCVLNALGMAQLTKHLP